VGKGNATSFVTLPSLISAYDKLPLVGIGQLFVGPEILAEGSRIYSEEGEAWARALDNMPAQDDAPADDDLEEMDTDEPIDF